jgi:hypothetical protein
MCASWSERKTNAFTGESLETKEETSVTKFCCRCRAVAAQSREGCGKNGADAWNTPVFLGKRTGGREEALARGCEESLGKRHLRATL